MFNHQSFLTLILNNHSVYKKKVQIEDLILSRAKLTCDSVVISKLEKKKSLLDITNIVEGVVQQLEHVFSKTLGYILLKSIRGSWRNEITLFITNEHSSDVKVNYEIAL
ncbi:hypothetical protein HHI36_019167 [Cryptolaemus montrouzieri]|uniref:Uncharacterized protein n=1 Tax=Cryptolaemus montrouzieri TaxID=559131 RepID=A0ABD2P270_9CUCU